MHFHDNPTDSQHHSAHTYEVSLGSTTALRTSDTARSTFGYQAELPPSALAACDNLTERDTEGTERDDTTSLHECACEQQ